MGNHLQGFLIDEEPVMNIQVWIPLKKKFYIVNLWMWIVVNLLTPLVVSIWRDRQYNQSGIYI